VINEQEKYNISQFMEQYTVLNSGELVELPLSLHDHEFVGGIYLSKMCHESRLRAHIVD